MRALAHPGSRVLLSLVWLLLNGAGCAAARPPWHANLQYGSQTHLRLPRFASLRARVANLRRGPGLRYPIKWVYRRHLPVLILREFDNWRLLCFRDGTRGWMSRTLLTPRRTFVVTVPVAILRSGPRGTASPVAHLRRGVVGELRQCKPTALWCAVRTHGYSGFVHRNQIWGSDFDARQRAD